MSGFRCEHPDFTVRCVPAGDEFRVRRACLVQGSDVFRDMFQCCDAADTLDLHEPPPALAMLFRLLHNTPPAYAPASSESDDGGASAHAPADYVHIRASPPDGRAIPFPLLPALLALADKYAVAPHVAAVCRSHLAAYAPTYPLRVYGMAVALGLDALAARASKFLLHPPLAAYTTAEVGVIPTAAAYHRLVLLHEHRIRRLRELLAGEPIFPQHYGECSKHVQKTTALWAGKKERIIGRMQAATDVAAEMMVDPEELSGCEACRKAWVAATSMLGYKCSKIPRRTDRLPASEIQ